MSQKVIIGIMGLIILGGGGVWYYQTNMADSDSATGSKSSVRNKDEAKKDGGMFDSIKEGASSFVDVMGGGGAQQCQFSGTDPESGEFMEGVIYVDGENFVLKADTVIEGQEGVLNMIQEEKVMYMWTDDEELMPGIKIDVSMFEDMPDAEKPPSILDELKDPESGFESRCKSWAPRKDSFQPPEDVEFIDMFGAMGGMFGAMMGEGGMMGGDMFGGEGSGAEDESSDRSSDDWGY